MARSKNTRGSSRRSSKSTASRSTSTAACRAVLRAVEGGLGKHGHPFDNNQFGGSRQNANGCSASVRVTTGLLGNRMALFVTSPRERSFFTSLRRPQTAIVRATFTGSNLIVRFPPTFLPSRLKGLTLRGPLRRGVEARDSPSYGRKTKPDETPEEFADRMIQTVAENPGRFFQRQMIYRLGVGPERLPRRSRAPVRGHSPG